MLEYNLTVSDLKAYVEWRARQGWPEARERRFRMVGAWLIGAVAYLVVFAVLTLPLLLGQEMLLAGATELIDIAVGVAVGWAEWRTGRVGKWLLRRESLRRAKVSLERTGMKRGIWLEEDGLKIGAGARISHLSWNAITGVDEGKDHVFVRTSADAAHVIPRSPEVDELVGVIRSRIGG